MRLDSNELAVPDATRQRFSQLFPDGVYITVEVCQRVAGEFSWDIMAEGLLTSEQRKRFHRASLDASLSFGQLERFMLDHRGRRKAGIHKVINDTWAHFRARLFAELLTEPSRMNPVIKKKWLEALRSGRYTQTTSYLRIGNCHCLTGVLCDVVDPHGWAISYRFRPYSYIMPYSYSHQGLYSYSHQGLYRTPSPHVQHASDLDIPVLIELTRMNDDYLWSFDRCADWIEDSL